MKPIDFRELQQAVLKHEQKKQLTEQAGRLQNLIHNLHQPKLQRLAIPLQDGYVFCTMQDIIMCVADGNYTHIRTLTHGNLTSSKTLGEFESLLPQSAFFRCHKSYVINLDHILKFKRGENLILMKGDFTADLATRRREEFFSVININGKVV